MLRCRLTIALLAALAAWSPALAGPPSAYYSHVPPRLVSCPAGDSSFVVIVRGARGDPWGEDCCVTLHLCPCPSYRLSRVGAHPYSVDSTGCVVSVAPDPFTGYAAFPLAGGGLCPDDSIFVWADGVWLRGQIPVVSLDQNGDLRVDSTDVAIVRSKLGTSDPTADFDGDDHVTDADVAIVRGHLGHHAPDATTSVPPPISGVLALSLPQPNPFAHEARFVLTLDRSAHVEASVHDLSGRRVAQLLDGEMGLGQHALTWQRRRTDGSLASSGVYFVQVHVGRERLVRRTIFLAGN